ncbi:MULTISPECIES: hypothetical protein [unclassified Pseudoalteromonas]|uniref:hypothetical protein n=1 Tax=unclassified Pseudoalteromonas TaxID=194690 RepID=UPI0030153D28
MIKQTFFALLVTAAATGCDALQDSKAQLEQDYLSQHQQLQQAITQIREQGIASVKASAETGSVAACVAKQLDADPMGALATVEGALQDNANLGDILAAVENLSTQEISLDQLPELIQQGADTVRYLKTLLSEYDLSELKQQAADLLATGEAKSEDVGAHLRTLIESCQTK